MAEETKQITCPGCDNEIKGIKQFPLAQITSFNYIPLPDLIKGPVEGILPLQVTQRKFFRKKVIQNPQISEEITQRLNQSNEFSYQGRVYERVTMIKGLREVKDDFLKQHPDMTDEDFVNFWGKRECEPGVRVYTDLTNDVKGFLSEQQSTLKTLEESVGKTIPTKDFFNLLSINNRCYTDLREFSFSINEHDLGECVLNVDSARFEADIHFGFGPGTYMMGFSLEVARFGYNGLFRER